MRSSALSTVSAPTMTGYWPAWLSAPSVIPKALALSLLAVSTISCAGQEKRIAIEERTQPIQAFHPNRPTKCLALKAPPAVEIIERAAVVFVALPAADWVALMKALECRAAYQAGLEALVDHYRAGHDAPASR